MPDDTERHTFRRNGTFYINRRVPTGYASVENRKVIYQSLKTKDPDLARKKAAEFWEQMLVMWEAKLDGKSDVAAKAYDAAQRIARLKGFAYVAMETVSNLPTDELLDRVEAISITDNKPDAAEANALLGAVGKPAYRISECLELFFALTEDKTLGKDDDQIRKWRNPRKRAINNFIGVCGDLQITELERDNMLEFRQWLVERMQAGDIATNTANKDITHFRKILQTVNDLKKLGLDLPLAGLSFRENDAKPRPPFSDRWINEKILAPNALATLNTECRILLLGMINTGYRPSEGIMLNQNTIRLDHNIPHISIEPGQRQLKTIGSKRVVPLTGVSLEAFRELPGGFERYIRDNSSNPPTNTINKYLRENGLRETADHTMYSFRHRFEDRMLENGVDERIRRDLMGHKLDRERYGVGASLEHTYRLLAPFAL